MSAGGVRRYNPTMPDDRSIDEATFHALAERHRRELHVHCYRMLGSFDEAEDLVQETYLRAWRGRERFEGGPLMRAWLYRIATNACLDHLRRVKRQAPASQSFAEIPWIQPYPDHLLDEIAPTDEQPDVKVVTKETIELSYLAVIQLLTPHQRAVLILRDVLDWSASETASALEISVAAANSALQRARATLQARMPARDAATPEPSVDERALLQRLLEAHERADVPAAVALMRDDVRVTMPPNPWLYEGVDVVRPLLEKGLPEPGEWRLVLTRANRMPAAACYLRAWDDTEFRAFKLDLIRLQGGLVAELTTFGNTLFPAFGLPEVLHA
jgi:RNA polymerase sigma-70 factor (TIGR02960 family)